MSRLVCFKGRIRGDGFLEIEWEYHADDPERFCKNITVMHSDLLGIGYVTCYPPARQLAIFAVNFYLTPDGARGAYLIQPDLQPTYRLLLRHRLQEIEGD